MDTDQQLIENGLQQQAVVSEVEEEPQYNQERDKEDVEATEIEEAEYANLLAVVQTTQAQLNDFYHNQTSKYKHPSYFKYFVILFPLAIVADLADFLATIAIETVILTVILILISILCNFLILVIFLLFNKKRRDAKNFAQEAQETVASIKGQYQRLIRTVSAARQGTEALSAELKATQIARQAKLANISVRGSGAISKFVRVSSTGVELSFLGFETIPFVDFGGLLTLTIVSVALSYWAETITCRNARNTIEETYNILSEEINNMVEYT